MPSWSAMKQQGISVVRTKLVARIAALSVADHSEPKILGGWSISEELEASALDDEVWVPGREPASRALMPRTSGVACRSCVAYQGTSRSSIPVARFLVTHLRGPS